MEWNKALIEIGQFGQREIGELFGVVREIEQELEQGKVRQVMVGKVLANLFYEPSTRTSSSFYAAMVRQGGSVIPINDVTYSSVSKGETLADTVRTLACYADVIALRHPADDATLQASKVCPVPVINAGNGKAEHPTQALLDLYTMVAELKLRDVNELKGRVVALVGDLLYGRTVHSLVKLLRLYGAQVLLVAPDVLQLPAVLRRAEDRVVSLEEALGQADVMYVTRVQQERLPAELKGIEFGYRVGVAQMALAKRHMVLMHPLPRVGEIEEAVDADGRAAYFRQMRYGMVVRMGILRMMLGEMVG